MGMMGMTTTAAATTEEAANSCSDQAEAPAAIASSLDIEDGF